MIGSLSTDWIWCLKDMLGTVNDVYALHGLLKSHAQLGVNTIYSFWVTAISTDCRKESGNNFVFGFTTVWDWLCSLTGKLLNFFFFFWGGGYDN